MRVSKQFGGDDYRKKLWAEIQKRGIESDADNYQLASIEGRTRKLNTPAPRSTAGDRIRAVAKALEDESKIQKGATVGILKSAEKLYVNQNKMIGEVATMVNEDLDRAARGTRKMFDPAQTPVRIPNQRSSSEPRKRGRSVD